MCKNGWIKIYKQLEQKAFYKKDSEKVHLWLHLLFKASHLPREEMLNNQPILIPNGKFTTGRKQLNLETGISESKIERILTYFEKIEQQIEQQKFSTNRLISIINWEQYQETEQRFEQQVNNGRTTSEQQVNTLLDSYKTILDSNKNKKEEGPMHELQKFVIDNYFNIKKIPKQLTFIESENLIKDFSKNEIKQILDDLENYKKINNYTNLNLTIRKWLKLAKERKANAKPIYNDRINLTKQDINQAAADFFTH